jgi:hypothetical protein
MEQTLLFAREVLSTPLDEILKAGEALARREVIERAKAVFESSAYQLRDEVSALGLDCIFFQTQQIDNYSRLYDAYTIAVNPNLEKKRREMNISPFAPELVSQFENKSSEHSPSTRFMAGARLYCQGIEHVRSMMASMDSCWDARCFTQKAFQRAEFVSMRMQESFAVEVNASFTQACAQFLCDDDVFRSSARALLRVIEDQAPRVFSHRIDGLMQQLRHDHLDVS